MKALPRCNIECAGAHKPTLSRTLRQRRSRMNREMYAYLIHCEQHMNQGKQLSKILDTTQIVEV